MKMKYDIDENVIQWLNGEKYITCTFTQKKYINKIKKIAQRTPEFVLDLIENSDGSIYCKLPLKALKLSIIIRKEAENEEGYSDDRRAGDTDENTTT